VRRSIAFSILLIFAGLMGAGGVVLAAAGAHAAPHAGLGSAAYLLLFHATAVLGGTALTQQGLLWRPLALAAGTAWIVGVVLFAGDVSARAFIGHRLFPLAAPTGATILIAAWLALAAAALVAALQRG
jgi:uncharacterized membrane protein YgdD (TMEM256/DUF423 family)